MNRALIARDAMRVTGATNERLDAVNGPCPVTGGSVGRCRAERRVTHNGGARTDSAGVQ
jgi:hypothetical protein